MKMVDEDDQLEVRIMDEIINIEKKIGMVAGIIGLQFAFMAEQVKEEDVEWEQFPEKVVEFKAVAN